MLTLNEMGLDTQAAFAMVQTITRDKCRTPMQWSAEANAGFSPAGVSTWLPVNPNYAQGVNVAEQDGDPDSLLNFYRHLLAVRKAAPALIAGDYQALHPQAEDYFAFLRRTLEQTCLVVLNYVDTVHTLSFDLDAKDGRLVFSNKEKTGFVSLTEVLLEPYEILILEI